MAQDASRQPFNDNTLLQKLISSSSEQGQHTPSEHTERQTGRQRQWERERESEEEEEEELEEEDGRKSYAIFAYSVFIIGQHIFLETIKGNAAILCLKDGQSPYLQARNLVRQQLHKLGVQKWSAIWLH